MSWKRIDALFADLVELPSADRAARLSALRDTEPDLATELTSLLEAEADAESFFAFAEERDVSTAVLAGLIHQTEPERPSLHGSGQTLREDLGGRYELRRRLGHGGAGVVYRAWDRELEEDVAIKVLHRGLAADPASRRRLKREIKVARSISHPHVLRIHDYGFEGDEPFICMELLEASSLADRLSGGALSVPDAFDIATQVAEGLTAAHDMGVVHRDIKPGNVLFDSRGRAKLCDFGVAHFTAAPPASMDGRLVGTPYYLPPELSDFDARSDVYSFGVMLFEMLTGAPPFSGDSTREVVEKHQKKKPPRVRSRRSDTPPELEDVVLRCLAKKPDDRYADGRALLEALGQARTSFESGTPRRSRLRRMLYKIVFGD